LGTVFAGANIQLIDKTTEVVPGITLIALVSDAPGTKELKELSLAINTPDGIVLVVGCSHPGIENIVAEAAKINPHIHFIAGGFHLVVAQDSAIEKVAATLHDTYKADYIAPGHCTGEPTFAALERVFGDRYVYAGLGTTLDLGTNPRAASDRRAIGVLDGRICVMVDWISCGWRGQSSVSDARRASGQVDRSAVASPGTGSPTLRQNAAKRGSSL